MSITFFVILIEVIICSFSGATETTDMGLVSWLFFVVNTFITIVGINRSTSRYENRVRSIVSISLFLHVFVIIWNIYFNRIFTLPNTEGDAEAYAVVARSFAWGSRANLPIQLDYFPSYVGKVYQLIGEQRLTIQFFNAYLGLCSIVLIYKILFRLGIDEDISYRVTRFLCILPNLLIISSAFLQESIIAFLVVSSTYCFIKWFQNEGSIWIVVSILLSFWAGTLHMGGLVCALAFAMTTFMMDRNRKLNTNPSRMIIGVICLIAVLAFLSARGSLFLRKIGGEISTDSILQASGLRDEGGSAYTIGFGGNSSIGMLISTPIRMIYFVFSPLPWDWRGLSDILAFFGSSLFYIASVKNAIKVYRLRHYVRDYPLYGLWFSIAVVCIIASIMFGWGVSNSGTALRHREKFTYIFGLLYALSLFLERKAYEPTASGID